LCGLIIAYLKTCVLIWRSWIMYKYFMIILLAVIILFSTLYAEEAAVEVLEYEGSLMQVSGIWFLNTGSNMFGLELGTLSNTDGVALELAAGDTIKVKGNMQDAVLQVIELIKSDITYLPALEDEEQSSTSGYQVNASRCISCRLCVKSCPVGAISMQKGKAVINVNKCIQCGICANGNGQGWKGCPVGAIEN